MKVGNPGTVDSGGRPAILIVDDIEANLVALEALLDALPCDVVRASSGNEALLHLLKRDFAVVLLDVQMPDMDGFEVARFAHNNPATRDVPIVFVTAIHDTPDNVLRGYDSGAFDLLFKPISPYVVRSKVQVFLDLYSSRRRLLQEIAAHKATLAELEAFNYSVSHDLRAPLRPLLGFSEILLAQHAERLDPKAIDYLKRIRAAAERMGQLIEDLLELSRVSRTEVVRRVVDLSALVEEIATELRRDEPNRDIEIRCASALTVEGDPRLLKIVLENLLRNAWKFTRNQPSARIELGPVTSRNEPTFFVRDNGVGFDSTAAGNLFEPFQRMHKVSEFEGTGIGLAIVKRIIQRHDGRIWADAAPGAGATFTFTVPRRATS